MESNLDILRKPSPKGKLLHMLRDGRTRLHKTQEKSAEVTQFDYPALFPPTRVASTVCLLAWILTQLLYI